IFPAARQHRTPSILQGECPEKNTLKTCRSFMGPSQGRRLVSTQTEISCRANLFGQLQYRHGVVHAAIVARDDEEIIETQPVFVPAAIRKLDERNLTVAGSFHLWYHAQLSYFFHRIGRFASGEQCLAVVLAI